MNQFQTNGDDPVEMMDDFENVEPNQIYMEQQDDENNQNYSSNNDLQEDMNQYNYNRSYEPAQKLSLNSLSQLMGKSTAKDFAKEFVYGDQRKIIQNLEKSQRQQENNSQFQSMHRSQYSLAQRFCSPQQGQRSFGNEINGENMQNTQSQQQSDMTKYSEQLKKTFREKNADRAFTAQKNTEILLSPTNVTLKTQPPSEYQGYQKDVSTRLSLEHDIFKKKKQDLREKYKKEEMDKCTFQPAINKKPHDYYDKGRFQRVMDQKKIEIMKKNDQLKEDLDNKITESLQSKPNISERTKLLADRKKKKQGNDNQNVVDRLFTGKSGQNLHTEDGTSFASTTQTNQIANTLQNNNYEDPECTFKPHISQTSHQLAQNQRKMGQKVDNHLYEDAKKRQQKLQYIQENLQNQKHTKQKQDSQINLRGSQTSQVLSQLQQPQQNNQKSTYNLNHTNKVSVQANIDRFRKEVETAYYAVVRNKEDNQSTSNDNDNFLNAKINYYEMVEMMKVMYFLSESHNDDWASSHHNASSILAQKVWYQLNGSQNNFIVCRNLLVFLYAVQNLHVTKDTVDMVNSDSRGDLHSNNNNLNTNMSQSNNNAHNNYQIHQQYYNVTTDEFKEGNSQRISHPDITNENYEQNNFNNQNQEHENIEYQPQNTNSDQQQQDIYNTTEEEHYEQQDQQQPTQQSSQNNYQNKIASELKPDERPQTNFSPGHIFNNQEYLAPEEQQQNGNFDSSNERRFMDKLNNIKIIPKVIGFYDSQGNLHLTEENSRQIHKYYKAMYMNRLSKSKGTTHYRKLFKQSNLLPPEQSYQPQISEISKQIAENKRDRIINHIKSSNQGKQVDIDLNTILCYQKKMGEEDKKILKCEYEDEQLEECTFQPQTKNYSQVSKHYKKNSNQFSYQILDNKPQTVTSTKPSGVKRTQELYQLAKPHIQKRDRLNQEIEYEKQCDECTFQPDILLSTKKSQQNSILFGSQYNQTQNNMMISQNSNTMTSPYKNHSTQLKGKSQYSEKKSQSHQIPQQTESEKKEIERIKKARLDKQLKNKQLSQGYTYNDKKTQNMSDNIKTQIEGQQRLPKQKRKAPTNSGNVSLHSRSNNSSQFKKMASGNNSGMQSPYYDNYVHGGDNTGNQDEPNEYMPKQQNFFNGNRNYGGAPTNMSGSNGLPPSQGPSVSHTQKTAEEDKVPLLFVDVNIEEGKTARIIVYEDDSSEELATKFTQEHGLDPSMKSKLKDLLDQQINSLLTKIDEEAISDSSSVRNQ